MTNADSPELSVVVPLHWSEATVVPLVDSIGAALRSHNTSYEIVFVDDGSGDRTWDTVLSLLPANPELRGIRLTRNFGQQAALGVGLEAARGSWIVTMDADLQDDPVYLPALLETARSGYDVVLAQSSQAVGTRSTRITSRLFYRLFNRLTGVDLPRGTGAYRIMSRRVVDYFLALPDRTDFFGGMISWFGFPTTTMPVVRHERKNGDSGYSFRRRLGLASSALISFSTIPLKISAIAGTAVCALALALGIIVVVLRLTGVILQAGFAGLMVALLFMSGTILLSTGILGFYLGSLIKTVSRRPSGVISVDTAVTRS
jgi:glycosyltransferase involved in cell wall biosynthesis